MVSCDCLVLAMLEWAVLMRVSRLLLRYASRDTLDVFQQGSSGLRGLRSAISDFTETAPLYGFLQFRQKRVVLKYTPEGTSRLLLGNTSPSASLDKLLTKYQLALRFIFRPSQTGFPQMILPWAHHLSTTSMKLRYAQHASCPCLRHLQSLREW